MELVSVGPAGGRPLLVLHGGPGERHDVLRPWLDALASERAPSRRVVFYDQRREPVDHRAHVADVEMARLELGVASVDLLGFSWGALLAVLFALEHPEATARLVLVSPPPMHGAADAEVQARIAAASARPEVLALGDDPLARRIGAFLHEPARVRELRLGPVDADVAAAASRSLSGIDLRPRLPSLRSIPALVVHGEDDPIPTSTAAETAALLDARLALLERCGHAPFFEAAGRFAGLVGEFLDAQPTRETRGAGA